jgi:hypothetical protein
MEGVRGNSRSRQPPRQLECKHVHQQFRLSVGVDATVFSLLELEIVHVEAWAALRLRRRDIDDARWRAGLQQFEQEKRQ